jgi:hypothetical protein
MAARDFNAALVAGISCAAKYADRDRANNVCGFVSRAKAAVINAWFWNASVLKYSIR